MLEEIIKADILLDGALVLAGVNTMVVIDESDPHESWRAYLDVPTPLAFGAYTIRCNNGRTGTMHLTKRQPGPKGLTYQFQGMGWAD